MDLHELLKVEECLRDRQFVGTASGGQETFEFRSVRKLENDFVDLSEWLWVDKDAIFSVQNCRHE